MKHLTMQQLEDLGFPVVKSTPEGIYVTQIRRKGCLTVHTKYILIKRAFDFVEQVLQIDGGKFREFKPKDLAVLDRILNTRIKQKKV